MTIKTNQNVMRAGAGRSWLNLVMSLKSFAGRLRRGGCGPVRDGGANLLKSFAGRLRAGAVWSPPP